MQFNTKFQHYMTLMSLFLVRDIQKTRVFNEDNFRPMGSTFQDVCANIVALHEAGLTRLREVRKNNSGQFVELKFEQVFTPAGEALRNEQLRYEMEPDVKRRHRDKLERMAITGESSGPLINSSGEVLDGASMNSLFSPDQIREHAKQQLKLMDEADIFDAAKTPNSGTH